MLQTKAFNRHDIKLMLHIGYGLLGGFALGLLSYFYIDSPRAHSWIAFFGYMLVLAYDTRNTLIKSLLITFIVSGFVAEVWSSFRFSIENIDNLLLTVIFIYAINAYNIAYQKAGYPFSYPHLFYAVWDTINKLFIASIICFLAGVMMNLIITICYLIHLNLIVLLLNSHPVAEGLSYFIFMLALYVADRQEKIIKQMRTMLLNLCKIVLPILSATAILYFIWLCLTLISLPYNSYMLYGYENFCLLGIFFINGVFRLGEADRPYSKEILLIVNSFIVLLPVIALLCIGALFDSISKGNPVFHAKYIASLVLLLSYLLYGLCYCFLVFRHEKKWMHSIKEVNINLGYVLLVAVFCINNTVFNMEISKRNRRLFELENKSYITRDQQSSEVPGFKTLSQ